MSRFKKNHNKHIAEYGADNAKRLTGEHETQHIEKFTWGVGDRGSSIRVPISVENNNWCGYIEDRRPASNCDPYAVARLIIGATNGRDADPGTIRGDFGMDIGFNLIHGSDGEETASSELSLWFPEGTMEWDRDLTSWVYE